VHRVRGYQWATDRVDGRDAALFNAAQVTEQACQSDFMAVGGGMALDQPSVPVREGCGLGQITGYTVSDASDSATFQVNPGNINNKIQSAGYFGALVLVNVAYALTLHTVAADRDLPLPGLLIIDGPSSNSEPRDMTQNDSQTCMRCSRRSQVSIAIVFRLLSSTTTFPPETMSGCDSGSAKTIGSSEVHSR
jgi:hypothetical protein